MLFECFCPGQSAQLSYSSVSPLFTLHRPKDKKKKKKRCERQQDVCLVSGSGVCPKLALAVSNANVCSAATWLIVAHLCKSICLFEPSSFFCFDALLLTESADALESAALFLPRPAPPVALPFSAVPEAAAADLGGRPRRLTGGVSISALGAAFWLGSTWIQKGGTPALNKSL